MEILSGKPSLLMLNDYCLCDILQLLPLKDYLSLAETCSRLFRISQQYKKYKKIVVEYESFFPDSINTVEEFTDLLSVIGEHVDTVDVCPRNFDILQVITDYCSNLRSVELNGPHRGPIPFQNLKELKVLDDVNLSSDDWKNCFANNPDIETVCRNFDPISLVENMIPLLKMLPKLKTLKIQIWQINPSNFHHLSCLRSLTHFSLESRDTWNSNSILFELAEKLNLVELELILSFDADTFVTLKSFRNLQFLTMHSCTSYPPYRYLFPETTIFPTMLKQIKLIAFEISCSAFLSILKQSIRLEEFYIPHSKIFWDDDASENFPKRPWSCDDIYGSNIISRIEHELQAEKRKLKIFFKHACSMEQIVWHSDNLEIIMYPGPDKRKFDHTFKVV